MPWPNSRKSDLMKKAALLLFLLLAAAVISAHAETISPILPPSPAVAPRPTPTAGPLLMTVSLYFENAGLLVPETAQIPLGDLLENRVKEAVNRLIAGPATMPLSATLPKTAALRRVFTGVDRNLYLDFEMNITAQHPGGITGEIISVASICKTVMANFNADSVTILVEGKEVKTLAGHLDIERPITRIGCEALVAYRRE